MSAAEGVAGGHAPAVISPPRREAAVSQGVGVVALLIAGLQPVILGAMEREGRLSTSQIGLAATVELMALGLACGLAAALLKPTHVRPKIALACLLHAAAMFVTTLTSGAGVIVTRAAAGACAGVMLWLAIGVIARASHPERAAGVFVTVQTFAQLVLAAALPATVMQHWGVNGALTCLAAISLLASLASLAGPDRLAPLPKSDEGGRLDARSIAGLAAVFLWMAFIVALWVYLEPLAAKAGLSPREAGLAVALALGLQVLGGVAATAVGDRAPPARVLLALGTVNALILATLWSGTGRGLFITCVAAFGFLWLFALPFQTLLLIRIDPTRRASMQLGAAQLLGSSAGPLAASLVVGDGPVRGALILSAACLALALGLISVLRPKQPA
ncbi:MFS transporter [Caulobacter segnis]|uniref:MFS transporter n=1 Tax=Caulobacter segnis TaxID=88688 RepID=A0A2W5VEE0_9CAUL|nr:MFS transporter [Caulobacter segnis]PZR34896.1 MAG: MFS transporter [Caulobacter segnis]